MDYCLNELFCVRSILLVPPEEILWLSLRKTDDCSQHLQVVGVHRRIQISDSSNSEDMTATAYALLTGLEFAVLPT